MPPVPRDDRDSPAQPASPAARRPGWPRLVILVGLINLPLFFQGCESQRLQFTVGLIVPFAEIEADDQQGLLPAALTAWSWPKFAANITILLVGLWLATRFALLSRMVSSRWFPAILLVVAVAFDFWLVWPPAWRYVVWEPQLHLFKVLLITTGQESPSETVHWWAVFVSGRLYFALLVAGLSLTFVLVRLFLRRYFFVRTGSRWQIQLGGLVVVVVVLGSSIGMAVRLLMRS